MDRKLRIGLLYSRSGEYAAMSAACRDGALAAVADINADPGQGITIEVVERDPAGNLDLYGPLCAEMLAEGDLHHVVGCITSSSRKEVIPALEKVGGMLWYACPYEGFEASDRVIYTHACPNQHLLPLLHWTFPRYGKRGFLVGSNYIWGWEMNRVAREVIGSSGGDVTGERYLPLGDTDVGRLIEEIRATEPDFILNNLIGNSSHAFLRALRELRETDPAFAEGLCPVLSCNLTECETPALGAAAEGAVSAGPHFAGSTLWKPVGRRRPVSSYAAAAYVAVTTLARIEAARSGFPEGLRAHGIDPETHHMALPVLIARVEEGQFRVMHSEGAVEADPYLARRERWPGATRPMLKLVP
ncbi:transporter substrate-binding protein [uncultured Limimaricola sp.]|uniref:transporter substrate-binding protein n=1 Tax=uncultured Limimaricola sp. TaxID=2211667 RepID=UPI0030FA9B9A